MVSDKELRKTKRHRRKLERFGWGIIHLKHKSPDKRIAQLLDKANLECFKLADELTGDRLLETQKQK